MSERSDKRIPVRETTRERLGDLAGKGKTYDKMINELIDLWENITPVAHESIIPKSDVDEWMKVHCSIFEKHMVRALAEKAGMSPSEMIRHMILKDILLFSEDTKLGDVLKPDFDLEDPYGEATVDMDEFLRKKLKEKEIPRPG